MVRTVLITGCSDNGLGAGLAIAFHKAGGYKVIASARNLKRLGQVTAAGCDTIELDVLSADSIAKCVAELDNKYGKLDILLNNAGALCMFPVTDLKLESVREVFELNTFSLITMTQAFLPLLRKAPEGWIVNNTSCAACVSLPFQTAYNASKAAASSFTQGLRLEMEPFNIKVIELRTGSVQSVIFSNVADLNNKLPDNSLYALNRAEIDGHMNGIAIMDKAMRTDVWARKVVSQLTTSKPPIFIWEGGSASLVRWGIMLPIWVFDSMIRKMFGLDMFKQRLQASGQVKK